MMAARTPHLDAITRAGVVGRVQTIPAGMEPGSDVAAFPSWDMTQPAITPGALRWKPRHRGSRSDARDVAWRCNLITSDGERLIDYSAGEITSEEAAVLIMLINDKLGSAKTPLFSRGQLSQPAHLAGRLGGRGHQTTA